MKNYLFLSLILCSILSFGQKIKNLHPTISILNFNEKSEKEFNEKYGSPENESYWTIIGGGCSWYCGGGPDKVSASSFLKSQSNNDYLPKNAHDFSYKSAWVEGVPGYGIGEYLLYHFTNSAPVTEIIIVNGYVKSQSAWKKNSRVKKIKMYINDEPFAILNLKDLRASQTFSFSPITYVNDWSIKFEILEVYKGTKYDDVVISEIYFDGIGVHCLSEGTLITMADLSTKKIEDLTIEDLILSINEDSKVFESSKIEKLASPIHCNLTKLTLSSGETLICTKDHPLLSYNGRWMSLNPTKTLADYEFESVELLIIGCQLQTINPIEIVTIMKIEEIIEKQKTYTIVQLDKNKSFIANGIVVGTETQRRIASINNMD